MIRILLQVTTSLSSFFQTGPTVHPDTLHALPEPVKECSGISLSGDGGYWVINDSGNSPTLYKLDGEGKWLTEVQVRNTQNVDWEALGRDDQGRLWIGDFGNNRNARKDLVIYRVPETEFLKTIKPHRFRFHYPDQESFPEVRNKRHRDAESLILWDGRCFVLTKNRTEPFDGQVRSYEIPVTDTGSIAKAIFRDSLILGEGPMENDWITDAALSPDGRHLALLSYGHLWMIMDVSPPDFFGGRIVKLPFSFRSQKEAICFKDDSTLVIGDERYLGTGGFLYTVDISSPLKEHIEIRKNEVSVPEKVFRDTVEVALDLQLRGQGYYEFFDYEGNRIAFGKLGYQDRGKRTLQIYPGIRLNGTYMLNILIGDRPHGFILKRFVEMSPQEIIEQRGGSPHSEGE
ncbi:MAG: esterase-like activity of phytase family protein [Bacteroidota bacterium]|nr:esterase-like activity of phytase family protein [Bacteroidota bacterium]